MPWSKKSIMDERYCAIRAYMTRNFSKVEICQAYDISRPTLDKWIKRFHVGGRPSLVDRTSRPRTCPNKTSVDVETLIFYLSKKKDWQAHKINSHLSNISQNPNHLNPSLKQNAILSH